MIKKLMTALLVAALLFMSSSIAWGSNGKSPKSDDSTTTSTFDLLGATWE
jgi:hypothetical protein